MNTLLIVIIATGTGLIRDEYPMPSQEQCEQARRCALYASLEHQRKYPDSTVHVALTYCIQPD